MSLNLFNYNNSLFSGFSSGSSGMSNLLGDYMSIRNGSYGKLLKAYYAKDTGEKKTAGAIRRENSLKKTQSDSEEVKQYKEAQSDASTLKSAASSIRSNSKLFEQVEKTTTDENGEEKTVMDYDRDKISSAVKAFVKAYNSAIDSAYDQGSSIVQKKAASMVSETASNKNMLARVGITIGKNNKLEVDDEKLKTANVSTLKTLFHGSGSYASNIERKASDMASMTEQLAKTAASSKSSYNRTGNYSSFATGGIYDGFF
ncbi:MAG: flagellar filament capping protein FliD [Lachnospiraceae bacterium]|nr:flagellar filament capping protein FliD [Lachnospiraceae bacterium]